MSASEAWPRRPPGGRTRADRSPTMGGDTSSNGGDSGLQSPALGGAAGESGFRPRLELPDVRRGSKEAHDESPDPVEVRYKHEGTRLDKQKVARIAMAFGMAITPPSAVSPSLHASASSLRPPPSATSMHTRGTSIASSSTSSTSSYLAPPTSPIPPSPFVAPASHAAQPSPFGAHLLSVQPPPYLSPTPVLLPLLPSLKAQLAAVAKEFQLPSVIGLALYLVFDDPAARGLGEGRIGEGVWEILWRDQLAAVPPTLASDRGHGTYKSTHSLTPSASSRFGSDDIPPPSPSTSTPHHQRFTPRKIDPSESLLSRSASRLTPASLRTRKKLAFTRPSLDDSALPRVGPSSQRRSKSFSGLSPGHLSLGSNGAPSSISTSVTVSPPKSRVRIVNHRLPPPSSPFPASPSSTPQPTSPAPSSFSIVGTLEFDVDDHGASAWFERWLSRRGLTREPRPVGGWIAAAAAAASAARKTPSDSESEDDEEALADQGGYALLSEDDGEAAPVPHPQDEIESDSENLDDAGPTGDDPLSDVFMPQEAEFAALRAAREEESTEALEARTQDGARPRVGRESEGSVGLGLGIGLGFGLDDVEQRRSKDLTGVPLKLTGAALARDEPLSDQEEDEGNRGLREIEELLAQHAPAPSPPAFEEPAEATSTPREDRLETVLPPTPLKPRRKSSEKDLTTKDCRRESAGANPLNLTLAITSPVASSFPTLVTSPTSAFSPTGSGATGGLAYLRRGQSIDSYVSSGPSDGRLSAAIDGAFGPAGKRGSALVMQDTLADLEKVMRSLSPRELKIPNRDRPLPYSPGASSLSPAPSGSSFAVFPSPAFPPSAFMSPAGSPSIITSASSPRAGAELVPDGGATARQIQTLGKDERDKAVLSIASSFLDQKPAENEQGEKPLTLQTDDLPTPVWPAVPVSPSSPLLSDVPLPLRKDSPLASPRIPSPVPSRPGDKQHTSSASSVRSLGSPLSPAVGGLGQNGSFPFPQPPVASPLQAAFPADSDQTEDPARERSESVSTVNAKSGSGARFRNFVWGRAASGASLEEESGNSLPIASSSSAQPLSPASLQGSFPSPSDVPRHQSIPDSRGQPPSRVNATPAGRSVSDSSALEVVSQFGKFQLTPEMSSAGFQEMNFPSPPANSGSAKSSSGGKKRFRAPFTTSSFFGKNKKHLEISSPEIGEPIPQARVPFHHRQRSDPSDLPLSQRMPTSPRKISEGSKISPSMSQSFSTRSIASTLNGTLLSPPSSPTSAMSPRSVRRKPVPTQSGIQRSFSDESSLSIVPSIPDMSAEPPLPNRTTSLGNVSPPSLQSAKAASP